MHCISIDWNTKHAEQRTAKLNDSHKMNERHPTIYKISLVGRIRGMMNGTLTGAWNGTGGSFLRNKST